MEKQHLNTILDRMTDNEKLYKMVVICDNDRRWSASDKTKFVFDNSNEIMYVYTDDGNINNLGISLGVVATPYDTIQFIICKKTIDTMYASINDSDDLYYIGDDITDKERALFNLKHCLFGIKGHVRQTYIDALDSALSNGYITQKEYDEMYQNIPHFTKL